MFIIVVILQDINKLKKKQPYHDKLRDNFFLSQHSAASKVTLEMLAVA